MSLVPGALLGPYEITAKLGEGGMGEVYRATDTKLKREVAIKVLPAAFTADNERLSRFEREAQLLAQLNHPNIAAIYGLEESDGVRALVLELVDGPTLAERLESGPLSLTESLSFALQIAQALEEAHDKGIVHRDLKPQNIKASSEGKIKVLDFGLAKAMDPTAGSSAAAEIANSPTVSFAGTRQGVILGTAAYMAPEQARGAAVDKRVDIWAFGVVLYEMLTGERLFVEANVVDTLSAVMRKEIDLKRLPEATPPRLRELLSHCLERNLKNRLHDIADARLAIEDISREPRAAPGDSTRGGTGAVRSLPWRALPWALALLAIAASLIFSWRRTGEPIRATRSSTAFGVLISPPYYLPRSQSPLVDLSADGRTLLFVAESERPAMVMKRSLERLAVTPIEGTEGAELPALSPDGRWVAFFADGKLCKVQIEGGVPVALAEARAPRGVSWLPDGSLVFSPMFSAGLWRLPAAGGAPVQVSSLDSTRGERSHRWPQALPDGRTVIFTVGLVSSPGDYDASRIDALRLDTGERRTVLEGARMARYTASGYLLFQRHETLLAVRFDLAGLKGSGEPFVVEESVAGDASSGAGHFSVSALGALAFVPEDAIPTERALLLVDREGRVADVGVQPAAFNRPRFSPDGGRIAFDVGTGAAADNDVFVFELASRRLQRLTFSRDRGVPSWSADGRRIVYTRGRSGESGLSARAADGSGEEIRISSGHLYFTDAWLADGRLLVTDYDGTFDIRILDPKRGESTPLFEGASVAEYGAAPSPDGRWVAYTSTETGADEVFVESLPPGAGKWQVSREGGMCPVWSRDGGEIFFVRGSTLMAVEVDAGAVFRSGAPQTLFSGAYHLCDPPRRHFDAGPDGRFAVVSRKLVSTAPRELIVLDGWASKEATAPGTR